jgi:hypothetical protein
VDIAAACIAAMGDPAYLKPTVTLGEYDFVSFAWPKSKLREWYRKGK